MDSENIKSKILKENAKAVVHLRSQYPKKMGLVFGAGLSKSFKLPTWKGLVNEIAIDDAIKGSELLEASHDSTLPFQTQMLFEHYRKKRYGSRDHIKERDRELDFTILSDWLEIIREKLYSNKPSDFKKALSEHPYLENYIPIIRSTKLTVNYNFDDLLEKALFVVTKKEREGIDGNGSHQEEYSRGYESVTNASLQFRESKSIIYHPNGAIPEKELETPSDRFIFSENEFADQILDMLAGDFSTLLNHFSKNTCLFIGLSLDDQTLRNLLRQTARSNPGQYHYYVKYVSDEDRDVLTESSLNAIKLANFKVYNLITLFLNDPEIAALGELICMSDQQFIDFAEINAVRIKYPYYLTGSLGVGKSTSITYFRNLVTYDEWLEPRIEILSKPWDDLTATEKQEADTWIANQFRLKNDNVRNKKFGLFLLDRGPLDPLAFTPKEEWGLKAKTLLAKICPGSATWKVEEGCVILLVGNHDELALRLRITRRSGYTKEKLAKMEKTLKEIYCCKKIKIIDTNSLSPSEVAQRIAETIHLSDYDHIDLHGRLEELKRSSNKEEDSTNDE